MTGLVSKVANFVRPAVSQATDLFTTNGDGGFNVYSTLSTGLTMASASSAYFGAREQSEAIQLDARARATAASFQAQEADLESERVMLRSKQESNNLMDELMQTIAANRVAFAANGVDTSFGTPAASENSLRDLTDKKQAINQGDANANKMALIRQAYARRQDAQGILLQGNAESRNVRRTGSVNALGTIAQLIDRRIARG